MFSAWTGKDPRSFIVPLIIKNVYKLIEVFSKPGIHSCFKYQVIVPDNYGSIFSFFFSYKISKLIQFLCFFKLTFQYYDVYVILFNLIIYK